MSTRPRDSQRAKLYGAERAAFGPAFFLPEERFADISDIDHWLMVEVVKQPWFAARRSLLRGEDPHSQTWITRDGRGHKRATGSRSFLTFPRWSRNRYVILHELAHHLVIRMQRHELYAYHGPEFCDVYLWLVRHTLGIELARRLEAEYQRAGIKY